MIVAMCWSGISTGTEKLLFTGRMPPFPGLGYPLVPGYEGVGTILEAGPESGREVGDLVYVSGSRGFVEARGLFGGQAAYVVVPGAKTMVLRPDLGERGTLLALAATAHHALGDDPVAHPAQLPELIVGHGALGRLIARLVVLYGAPAPTVWETNPIRMEGARGYTVVHPDHDPRRNYRTMSVVPRGCLTPSLNDWHPVARSAWRDSTVNRCISPSHRHFSARCAFASRHSGRSRTCAPSRPSRTVARSIWMDSLRTASLRCVPPTPTPRRSVIPVASR